MPSTTKRPPDSRARRPRVQAMDPTHHSRGHGAARALGQVTIRYIDLVDHLAIAAEVTGLDVATVMKVTNLDLADSALHAPVAGFGDTDPLPRLCRQGRRPHRPARAQPPTPRRQQASRVDRTATLRRDKRLDLEPPTIDRRRRIDRTRDRRRRARRTRHRRLTSPADTVDETQDVVDVLGPVDGLRSVPNTHVAHYYAF